MPLIICATSSTLIFDMVERRKKKGEKMNYIVDPMIIYWIHVLSCLNVIAIFGAVLWPIIYGFIKFGGDYDEEEVFLKKLGIAFIIFESIFVLMAVFIPNKETLIEMAVAKIVTVDTLKIGKEALLDFIKEIVDVVR